MFDGDLDGVLNHSNILYMTSCLIEIAQFIYISNECTNSSPEVYANAILQIINQY